MMDGSNTRHTRSFASTMIAIAWSFVGLRRRKDFDEDVAGGFNYIYVIGGALIAVATFIVALLTVVHFAVT